MPCGVAGVGGVSRRRGGEEATSRDSLLFGVPVCSGVEGRRWKQVAEGEMVEEREEGVCGVGRRGEAAVEEGTCRQAGGVHSERRC